MNPRYEAYLKTTDSPKNWEFMAFISDMVEAYAKDGGNVVRYSYGSPSIVDQDDFTAFIQRSV